MSQSALRELITRWNRRLLEDVEARRKLAVRTGVEKKAAIEALELGLVTVPARESLPANVAASLESFGALDREIEGMAALPLKKRDGRITNLFLVSLNGITQDVSTAEGCRILRRGGVANLKALTVFKSVVLTDSMSDFFAYFHGVRENIIPLIESAAMPEDLSEAILKSGVEEIVFLNDSPRWDEFEPKLKDFGGRVIRLELPGNAAVRSYLEEHSPRRLLAYLEGEKARAMKASGVQRTAGFATETQRHGERTGNGVKENNGNHRGHRGTDEGTEEGGVTAKAVVALPPAEAPAAEKEYLRVSDEPGEIRFTGEERTYRVRGFSKDSFEKIVQLVMEVEGRAFPDKVDVARSQGRMRFAQAAAHEFEMSAETVKSDLAFIYKTLDKLQEDRFKQKLGLSEKTVYVISKDDEKKAIDRLTSRDLLTEILMKDTERLGYVEEEVNKKLFYLAGTSRLTGNPISVLDISPSGTGKSFGMSAVMELIPPDEMLSYSRLSPNALYYKNEDELRGKVLYIEELCGMEESLEPIRMLLSSGELSVSVVEKDPRTGTLRTVERRMKVNVPLLSGGTRDLFDEETLSRFVVTYNDLTPGHLDRVLKSQAARFGSSAGAFGLQREKILKRHRDFQKVMDSSLEVRIPFAEKIRINPRLHIATRKFQQYLRLIYTIAFVRQHSREKFTSAGGGRYIEAKKEDVALANVIMEYVLRYERGDLSKRLHDAYEIIVRYCTGKVKEKRMGLYEFKFSRREIRDCAGWEQTTAKRLFDELEALEYIRRVRGEKQGMQYLYRLVQYAEKHGVGDLMLLDPDTL